MCAQQSVIRNTRLILITQNYPLSLYHSVSQLALQLSSHYYHDVKWGRREVLRGRGGDGDKRSRGRLGMGINFRKYAGTGWGWGQRVRGRLGMGTNSRPRAGL